jgi:hypothetical protein
MQRRGTQLPRNRKSKALDVNERVERAFEAGTPIDEAFEEAFLEAVRQHKRLGQPLVFWKDGKTVFVPAEEVEAELNARKVPTRKVAARRKRSARKS